MWGQRNKRGNREVFRDTGVDFKKCHVTKQSVYYMMLRVSTLTFSKNHTRKLLKSPEQRGMGPWHQPSSGRDAFYVPCRRNKRPLSVPCMVVDVSPQAYLQQQHVGLYRVVLLVILLQTSTYRKLQSSTKEKCQKKSKDSGFSPRPDFISRCALRVLRMSLLA